MNTSVMMTLMHMRPLAAAGVEPTKPACGFLLLIVDMPDLDPAKGDDNLANEDAIKDDDG